jgi:acyl-CoA synthetase (AMP-forming)/AMP-acid ligase II
MEPNLNRTFLVKHESGEEYSYRDVLHSVEQCRQLDWFAGIPDGSLVPVVCGNDARFVVLALSCFFSGRPLLPIHPETPIAEVGALLSEFHLQTAVLTGPDSSAGTAVDAGVSFVSLSSVPLDVAPAAWTVGERRWTEFADFDPKRPALVMPTSGTTGAPRLIKHNLGSLIRNAAQNAQAHGVGPDSRFTTEMPMAFSGSIMQMLMVFSAGGSLVVRPAFGFASQLGFWETLERWSVNSLWLVPSMLLVLLKMARSPVRPPACRKVRLVICGSAPLSAETKKRFHEKFGLTVRENYGLSETLTLTASPEICDRVDVGVGRSLDSSVQIRVDGGEILVRTPNLMEGYISPDVSGGPRLDLDDGWFRTGDLGAIDSKGFLHIHGRKKELIIRGGLNIYPADIEAVIGSHPSVRHAAVIGVRHEILGEEVVAVVVPWDPAAWDAREIASWVRQRVASFKAPRFIIRTDTLPTTASGKLKRGLIQERLEKELETRPLAAISTLIFPA